jgi:hypothetical protein
MMSFFKRLLGLGGDAPPGAAPTASSNVRPSHAIPRAEPPDRRATQDDASGDVVNRYFELSGEIETGKRDRDYARAIRAARATYPILPAVVRQWKREYGRFDINTSHAVHTAPKLMAVMEDCDGIRELRAVLESVDELREWLPSAEEAEADVEMVPQIMALIQAEPGILQSSLKTRLPADTEMDGGSRASNLAAWLEKAGRIQRVKKGSSYQLYPDGYRIPTASPPSSSSLRSPSSPSSSASSSSSSSSSTSTSSSSLLAPAHATRARSQRSAAKARMLEFDRLPVVRLPRAPLRWEEREQHETDAHTGPAKGRKATGSPKFEVRGHGWALASEEKLALAERPDPAFKDVFPTCRYTHWLDPKGKREGFESAASVLRVTDRNGQLVAERGLAHDVYRSDVNADGTGILFLSREGMLHGYTETLRPFIEESLADLPEYRVQAERFGISPHELKNHTRTVAISSDRSRYLITVVDEAWCLNTATGEIMWGFRMPSKEGWTRVVADRSERSGTSGEVEAALRLMELEFPVTPDDITRQYRVLAMRWHPDRNPGDPKATARFQELGAAMELLTGSDLAGLSSREVERVTYEQVISASRVSVPDGRGGSVDMEFTISMGASEAFASDWIYAANFGKDGRAFLAGYSGKVVVVSPRGTPERAYDIGSVPRHIIDAREHLYILTDTRLYVLADDRLEALVDVYGASDVVVGDRGFALLGPKAVTWYSPDGRRLGSVETKDPLRRVLSTSGGLVIETRQHRARVTGAPSWWR